MKRLLLAAIALVAFASAANATVCLSGATPAGSATLKDAAASPNTFIAPYTDTGDASGNCRPQISVPDGSDVTQGAKADAAWASGSGSIIALLKNLANGIASAIPAGSAIIGKVGIDQTTPGTTNGVTDVPQNSAPTDVSASTSGSANTATTLISASATHHRVLVKVEGTSTVCFSFSGTASIGTPGTWCLKGASASNAGDGGSYATLDGMSDAQALSMISAGTSQLVYARWQ